MNISTWIKELKGWINKWMDECKTERMNEWMNERTWKYLYKNSSSPGIDSRVLFINSLLSGATALIPPGLKKNSD